MDFSRSLNAIFIAPFRSIQHELRDSLSFFDCFDQESHIALTISIKSVITIGRREIQDPKGEKLIYLLPSFIIV